MTRRIEASSMSARYTGLFIAMAAPDLPSAPWHPPQLSPYSVAKSVTWVGRRGSSACVGRPGSESHPPTRIAASNPEVSAKSDFRLRVFNLVLVLVILAEAGCLYAGANGERQMLQRADALGLVDYESRDRSER